LPLIAEWHWNHLSRFVIDFGQKWPLLHKKQIFTGVADMSGQGRDEEKM
jgi:hypothetical protein